MLWVRRDFVFLCRTTVRTCPFVSHAVSLDVQQYSRVQQKSLSINNLRTHHVCTIIVHTAVLKQKKKVKNVETGRSNWRSVQSRALYRWANRKSSDYLPSPGGQLWKIFARRVLLWRPFFRRRSQGLLCGWDLARSRGLGGTGGARERPVLKKHTSKYLNSIKLKILMMITMLTT